MAPGCWDSPTITTAVTLSAGVYYMKYGMTLKSGGSINGTDVTVVSDVGLAVDGNMTLTAPATGSYNGIALYIQSGGAVFNAHSIYKINGFIYVPTLTSNGGGIQFDSGTSNQGACTYIVAGDVTFNNGATFDLSQGGCTGSSGGSGALSLAQ
jgi:hypothetical protein